MAKLTFKIALFLFTLSLLACSKTNEPIRFAIVTEIREGILEATGDNGYFITVCCNHCGAQVGDTVEIRSILKPRK